MIPLVKAFRILDEALAGVRLPSETVEVRRALGRVIIRDQISRLELPPFDKSAMDGYAVRADDERQAYCLLESVPAGCLPTQPLVQGAAVKVMTGAPVPEGTGKVIMVERTAEADGWIRVHTPDEDVNICRQGEDVRRGDVILRAPAMLDPAAIGNLIACGIMEVAVVRPARVVILATGDEIVESPDQLAPGRIMNSNGPMLAALCRQYGLQVVDESVAPDDLAETTAALRRALRHSDIVVLTGGVSVGEHDVVADAIGETSMAIHFDRVAVKPGKPTTFASGRGKLVFGLPGNPVSAYLMFHLFVLRAVRLISGLASQGHYERRLLVQGYTRRKTARTEFVPCRLTDDREVQPVVYHGSADLRGVLTCDGFFIVPAGVEAWLAGETVDFLQTRKCPR